MKPIVLSADGDGQAYFVPDHVAENLAAYCLEFCREWLWNSPHAAEYRQNGGVCYNEADFIQYLNQWIFPDEPSVFIESIGYDDIDLQQKYQNCPHFAF